MKLRPWKPSHQGLRLTNMEIWKPIPVMCSQYLASSHGRIKNSRTGRILRPAERPKGYLFVDLCVGGKRKALSVHRAVMMAFFGLSNLQVNHKDGNKKNNIPENLEYTTAKENIHHGWATGLFRARRGERGNNAKLTEPEVIAIHKLLKTKRYTHKELGQVFGVVTSTISHISSGRLWGHLK